jgi:hypothetical protein
MRRSVRRGETREREEERFVHRMLSDRFGSDLRKLAESTETGVNSPQRVAKIIQKGWSQLSRYEEPKALVIVNDDSMAGVQDLAEAFNGFLEYRNAEGFGYANTASKRLANGRIRDLKWKIDLYIWIDRATQQEPVFRMVTDEGRRLARHSFGCPDLGAPPNKP